MGWAVADGLTSRSRACAEGRAARPTSVSDDVPANRVVYALPRFVPQRVDIPSELIPMARVAEMPALTSGLR